MATQVILLERIEKLGGMGEIVSVKPGYARNYLLPQKKALRATDSNIAYFETQKSALEKLNNEKKSAAEDHSKALKGLTVSLIRQAGEAGQLYGSVTARDIAETINDNIKEKIERNSVDLNQNFKEIGLFPVTVTLHPEVKVDVTVNIARTDDEAKQQLKTGKAMIANNQIDAEEKAAEKQAQAEADEKAQAKADAKAEKAAEAVEEEAQDDAEAVEASADESATAEDKKDA